MKRIIASALLAIGIAATAYADETATAQINDTFVLTKTWISQQKLVVVPQGSQDASLLGQEALLFYGEASGNPDSKTSAQRELMAKRAAVVLAQRSAAEYLAGVNIASNSSVKDMMAQSDDVTSTVTAFIKGTQVVHQEYSRERDMAVAIIKVGIRGPKGFAAKLYEQMDKIPILKKEIATDKPEFRPEPVKVDVPYDGLIVDATEQNFRPALINRIFTAKGDVLYDPAKISQKVLVEQGCGEYTNSVDKAKAALASRGVSNPLVLKASGSVSASDLQITDDDAVTVFSANQKSGFLAGAKVAFVLK